MFHVDVCGSVLLKINGHELGSESKTQYCFEDQTIVIARTKGYLGCRNKHPHRTIGENVVRPPEEERKVQGYA